MIPLFEMFAFVFLMSISPGPTNILSASYGKSKGFLNSLGFVTGAAIGFSGLAITIYMGLDKGIQDFPQLLTLLKYVGSIYIILLATCMVFFSEEIALGGGIKGRFLEGIFIQWVNPKSWISALSGVSYFAKTQETFAIFVTTEMIVGWVGIAFWAYTGEYISQILSTPAQQKFFSGALGISLAVVAIQTLNS